MLFVKAPDAFFVASRISFVLLPKQNGREQQSGTAPAEGFSVTAGAGALCPGAFGRGGSGHDLFAVPHPVRLPLARKRTVLPMRVVQSGSEASFAALPIVIAFEAKVIATRVGVAERQVTRHREHPLRNRAI